MGFAEDKVYDYILKNLKNFKNIRVASLADSLSCLTDADRDELHSREETRGSQATVYRFYQHLRCRQGWVLDLIEALRQNNAGHLADELQHVYDSCQARPTTTSVHPVASDSHRAASSIGAQMPSLGPSPAPSTASAQQPHQDLPVGSQSHLPSATSATSMDLDARAPVQESLPKTLLEQEPPLPGSKFHHGASDRNDHLLHSVEATQVASGTPGTASVAVPSVVPLAPGRDWLSRPQHPVCVDNGCFGNANHLQRGAPGLGLRPSLPPRDAGAARRPEQPGNEPEENVYVSTDSTPRLEETVGSRETQPPDSVPKNRAVPGSESPGSSVDVRSPLLIQQQFDAEQKRVRMLRGDGGGGDAQVEATTPVTTPAPGDASSDTSLKPPVQEEKRPVVEMAKSIPSMPAMEKVLQASADPLPPVAGSFGGTSERTPARQSSATSIWTSCNDVEGDVELSKPGVLFSVAGQSPEVAGRCPGSQEAIDPSSGVSKSLTFSSDPLMMSTDSLSSGETLPRVSSSRPAPAACADPREEETARASRDSCPPPSQDSTSLGTHEVRMGCYPSTQLKAGNDLRDGADPLGNPPVVDSSRGLGTATGFSEARVSPGDGKGPSLPYILPAVAVAAISAVAFLVYARWRK
ncbi:MAVS protein, partial [Halcyon senegalensis]|nr:MAVS protein [Halcyon senegalensis]